MKTLILKTVYLISIFVSLSACSSSDKKHEYEDLSNINFGEGVYRPNPFSFLDNLPPFIWMGLPDSVKKETELQIFFNEDAVRSHSASNIVFTDEVGNLIDGINIGEHSQRSFSINASSDTITVPIQLVIDPSVGDSVLSGFIVAISDNLDFANEIALSESATSIASWTLVHKTGINWWRWFIFLIVIVCILTILFYLIYGLYYCLNSLFRAISSIKFPSFPKTFNNKHKRKEKTKDKEQEEEQDEGLYHGKYISEGKYKINRKYIIPNGSQHKNPTGKTNGKLLDELGDSEGIILVKNGEPIFNKDGGTSSGKPLQITFKEGIEPYLKKEELQSGKQINRQKLHIEAFARIAHKYGMDLDELQVFKGNAEPIDRLKKKWNCSEQEVYNRCQNPHRIARVLHECKDKKTIQLVPWVYHHMSHSGGIEAVKRMY